VKLKRHGGGMRRCKMLLRRRKSDLAVCAWIRVDNVERYKVAKKTAK
jgi:hypothetical protein